MAKLFFSYAHEDETYRNELEIHLSALKRQGVIEVWHDRKILAGSNFDDSIKQELEDADIILLLVSQYFIASEYCYNIEMQRALQRHDDGSATVIPVILRNCDWHDMPFGKLMGTPKDGKPISKHADTDDAYMDIVTSIKKVAQSLNPGVEKPQKTVASTVTAATKPQTSLPRSSNLRVKKQFTGIQKHDFIEDTFQYLANFFEGSLKELCERNPHLEYRFKQVDFNHFHCSIYDAGESVSQCKIWIGEGYMGDIAYSNDITSPDNTMNDSVNVEDDGFMMYFKSMGFRVHSDLDNKKMSKEGVAEYFWCNLIEYLQ